MILLPKFILIQAVYRMKLIRNQLIICINNDEYQASLEKRKLYVKLADPVAEQHQQIRVIDESGEDYLYPAEYFVPVKLPVAIEEGVLKAA